MLFFSVESDIITLVAQNNHKSNLKSFDPEFTLACDDDCHATTEIKDLGIEPCLQVGKMRVTSVSWPAAF